MCLIQFNFIIISNYREICRASAELFPITTLANPCSVTVLLSVVKKWCQEGTKAIYTHY